MKNINNFQKFRNLFLLGIFYLMIVVDANGTNIFGPSSYEECVSDGKVGRTNAEISVHMDYCRKKFPKLQTLARKRASSINCSDIHDKSVHILNIKNNLVHKSGTKIEYKITLQNSEIIRFQGDGKDGDSGKEVTIYGELSISDGNLRIDVVYNDRSKPKIDYHLQCIEVN